MSESHVPFEAPGAAIEDSSDEAEVVGPSNRNRLVVLGASAAVVLVALLAYFLVFAGGGDSETPASAAPAGTPVAQPTPTSSANAAQPTHQRLNAKSFGRDPFKALIVDAVAATDPVAGAPAAATGSASAGAPLTGADSTSSSITGSSGGTTTTPTVTSDHTFRVVSVASDGSRVTVKVDGKTYRDLRAGEVFASYYKVVAIGGKVNGFQVGEERFSVLGTKTIHVAM